MDRAPVVVASAVADARRQWRDVLRTEFVVYDVAEWEALEQITSNLRPGILVLDLALPGLGRVAGLASVQRWSPATKTLVLTDTETDGEGICALKAGARGYYTRNIDAASLRKAVETVDKGEMWVKRALIPALVAGLVSLGEIRQQESLGTIDRRLKQLTVRQREVAEAIAKGASNKEIAAQLNVTERTVKSHLTEIFRNVGVLDRLHLALLLNNALRSPMSLSEAERAGLAPKNGRAIAGEHSAHSE